MSPATDNFIHSLVEMSKAFETLPTVQAELADARNTINQREATIQRLELKLLDRNNEISDLERKLRDAEVARDDAELRFLEADDRIAAFKRLIGAFQTDAVALVKATEPEPTHAEPVYDEGVKVGYVDTDTSAGEPVHVDPFANEPPAQGQSEPGPTPIPNTSESPVAINQDTGSDFGVSVPPNPTAPSTVGDGLSPETATAIPNAETGAGASSGRLPTDRDWAGMTWSQARATLNYVPYDKREWLEGGGREEDYYL